jgi:prepilin-type N-terminal cleavage/methylation domain-containing protein
MRKAGDAGFSLVEVLVAMLIITPAAIGAAGLVTVAVAAVRDAGVESTAVVLASQKLEQLRTLEWNADDLGRGGSVTSDMATDLTRDPATRGGAGLSASPAGTLAGNLPGFVDYLDAAGAWMGTGPMPPPRAVFIRRWAVTPLPDDPADTLVLQVLVTNVTRDAGVRHGPGRRARLGSEALVTTIRTRTSR